LLRILSAAGKKRNAAGGSGKPANWLMDRARPGRSSVRSCRASIRGRHAGVDGKTGGRAEKYALVQTQVIT